MRLAGLLLLLSNVASAQGLTLDDLFDPGNQRFGLRIYTKGQFARLRTSQRLIARGLDPTLWKKPPDVADRIVQANNVRGKLCPGFDYTARLWAKRRAFDSLVRRMPVERLIRALPALKEPVPREFLGTYNFLATGIKVRRKRFSHPLNALRHSERQFRHWFLDEIARRISALPKRKRATPIRLLERELRKSDRGSRQHAARVLGGVPDPRAARAIEHRVAAEDDIGTGAALVAARARIGGPRLRDVLVLWAGHANRGVRLGVVNACRDVGEPWAEVLLRSRVSLEQGRLRGDILRTMGGTPDGGVDFYGIRSNTKRVLFLVDVSGSMAFPMDGKDGKREPRAWRTKREISRALRSLPRDTLFNLMLFAHTVEPWKRRLVPATKENSDAAMAFLEQRPPLGGTNIFAVLLSALSSGADTVYLLTDGEASVGSVVDHALLLEEVAARNPHRRVVIHTVGLSRDQNAAFLVNLAHRSGGRYVADR